MGTGLRSGFLALCLWLSLLHVPAQAQAGCRQALLLATDVSGSVDEREYRLQLEGLARALTNRQVVAAFAAMPEVPVRLAVMEWSGPGFQRVIQPWVSVGGAADLAAIAARLRSVQRVQADFATAIGSALARGAAEVRAQSGCWRQVIDLSGDGKSNSGPEPKSVDALLEGITVNGLVIAERVPTAGEGRVPGTAELTAYFRAYVLHGPDAFQEIAFGFEDFEAAMVRKLLRELQVMAVSELQDPAGR